MKKVLLIFALAAFTTGFAQENKNLKTETVVTKTAVKDSKGVQESTKSVSIKQKQELELAPSDSRQVNQSVVMSPVKVDSDVTYDYDGNRFQFLSQKDEDGYRLMTVMDNKTHDEYAIIKPTSQNGYYIYSKNGKSSFGYFNEEGNFVVESYNPETDAVVNEVYKLQTNKVKQ